MKIEEFLLARIAEDEGVARLAGDMKMWEDERGERWVEHPTGSRIELPGRNETEPIFGLWLNHIARHDPARVLADCKAKRGIVERARLAAEAGESALTTGAEDAVDFALEGVLRLLALPYADHPDFDPSWRQV